MENEGRNESSRRSEDGPSIEFIRRTKLSGPRLGVFASSFNPPTIAHVEIVRRAAEEYDLDEILVLASKANADKIEYECSLEDRLAMITAAFGDEPKVSIGISSHAFYVDMLDALEQAYSHRTDLHFIVGFDTFERVLDFDERYSSRYSRHFGARHEALEYLFGRSRFIVAGRAGRGPANVKSLVEHGLGVPPERVLNLDFPADLGELSATEVRERRRAGRSITGLVPPPVEKYIEEHQLYETAQC